MNESKIGSESTNGRESLPSPVDEHNDDAGCMLDLEIALRRKYSRRWAPEIWLLRRYLHRCRGFLTGRYRTVEVTKENPDEPPF